MSRPSAKSARKAIHDYFKVTSKSSVRCLACLYGRVVIVVIVVTILSFDMIRSGGIAQW